MNFRQLQREAMAAKMAAFCQVHDQKHQKQRKFLNYYNNS